ncbi:hypothetical protein ACO2Q3_18990 [Caulobacter sp. KR2-114]|uniref:hypothetical protein n=1 Tax=Caulobacter sp. KR2-114 TaxID=3400912 RepID=UPI003BFF19FE
MLFVDSAEGFLPFQALVGWRHIREADLPHSKPACDVAPGWLALEGLAQTAAILVAKSAGHPPGQSLPVITGIEHCRFRAAPRRGDMLRLRVRLLKRRRHLLMFSGVATVNGAMIASGRFSATHLGTD